MFTSNTPSLADIAAVTDYTSIAVVNRWDKPENMDYNSDWLH